MLTLRSLSCARNGAALFERLGISLLPGCLLAVKGANGSGKSSLLKIVAGLLAPDAGAVLLGRDGSADVPSRIAFLGHKDAVFPDRTVEDQLYYWAALYGTRAAADASLRFYGLDPWRRMRASALSAGRRKRLALARVLCSDRPVWLLDEPETHLDEEGKDRLMHAVSSRCYNGGVAAIATNGETADLAKRAFMPVAELALSDFMPVQGGG
jgi:heme exporter protein A